MSNVDTLVPKVFTNVASALEGLIFSIINIFKSEDRKYLLVTADCLNVLTSDKQSIRVFEYVLNVWTEGVPLLRVIS